MGYYDASGRYVRSPGEGQGTMSPSEQAAETNPAPLYQQADSNGEQIASYSTVVDATGTHKLRPTGIFGMGGGPTESNFEADPYAVQLQDFSGAYGTIDATRNNMFNEQANNLRGVQGLQRDQTAMLGDVQQGKGPSVAREQMRQGLDAAQRNAMALAITGRGGPGAQLAAQQSQQQMALQGNQQAAMLRAQEIATARDQYGAAVGAQADLANQLGAAGQQYAAQGLQSVGQQQAADVTGQQLQMDAYNAAMNANQAQAAANLNAAVTQREGKKQRTHDTLKDIGNMIMGGPAKG